MNQTWENVKKPNFKPNFGPPKIFLWVFLLLDFRHCCKLSLYAISSNNNEPNFRKMAKNLISDPILARLA